MFTITGKHYNVKVLTTRKWLLHMYNAHAYCTCMYTVHAHVKAHSSCQGICTCTLCKTYMCIFYIRLLSIIDYSSIDCIDSH